MVLIADYAFQCEVSVVRLLPWNVPSYRWFNRSFINAFTIL